MLTRRQVISNPFHGIYFYYCQYCWWYDFVIVGCDWRIYCHAIKEQWVICLMFCLSIFKITLLVMTAPPYHKMPCVFQVEPVSSHVVLQNVVWLLGSTHTTHKKSGCNLLVVDNPQFENLVLCCKINLLKSQKPAVRTCWSNENHGSTKRMNEQTNKLMDRLKMQTWIGWRCRTNFWQVTLTTAIWSVLNYWLFGNTQSFSLNSTCNTGITILAYLIQLLYHWGIKCENFAMF